MRKKGPPSPRDNKNNENGPVFVTGRRNSASTLGEIFYQKQQASLRQGPPEDARQFRNALLKKFGKLSRAWEAIDANDDGKLQFNEFVRACRNIQFAGNFKRIFKELSNGEVSIGPSALDPNLASELAKKLPKS